MNTRAKNEKRLLCDLRTSDGPFNSTEAILGVLSEKDKETLSTNHPEIGKGPYVQTSLRIDAAILTNWTIEGLLPSGGVRTNPQQYPMSEIDAAFRSAAACSFRSPVFQLRGDLIVASPLNGKGNHEKGTESNPCLIHLIYTDDGYKIIGTRPEKPPAFFWCQFALQINSSRIGKAPTLPPRKKTKKKEQAPHRAEPPTPPIANSPHNKTFKECLLSQEEIAPREKDKIWIKETKDAFSNLEISDDDVAKNVDNICASVSKPTDQADWIARAIYSTKTNPTRFHRILCLYTSERGIDCPSLQVIYRLSHWGLTRAILEKEGCARLPDDDQVVRILSKSDRGNLIKFWKYVCKEASAEAIRKEDLIEAAVPFLKETGIKIDVAAEKTQMVTNEAMKIIRPEVKKLKEASEEAPESRLTQSILPLIESIIKALDLDPSAALKQLGQDINDKITPKEEESPDGLL